MLPLGSLLLLEFLLQSRDLIVHAVNVLVVGSFIRLHKNLLGHVGHHSVQVDAIPVPIVFAPLIAIASALVGFLVFAPLVLWFVFSVVVFVLWLILVVLLVLMVLFGFVDRLLFGLILRGVVFFDFVGWLFLWLFLGFVRLLAFFNILWLDLGLRLFGGFGLGGLWLLDLGGFWGSFCGLLRSLFNVPLHTAII